MTLAIPFPQIDPVALEVGPFVFRWYALAYIAGLLAGWALLRRWGGRSPLSLPKEAADDFFVWATLGVILGGRLGFVLFYNLSHYMEHPLRILMVWEGGMAFHGGLLGVVVAMWLFTRRRGISFLAFGDVVCRVVPIGLFLGRLANFVNGELWGRPTTLPWGMVFPGADDQPRHPSQLYEAALEGLVLFAVINLVAGVARWRERPGLLGGVFLSGYAVARILVEMVRQPDPQLGFLMVHATMGQLLSVPMLILGLYLILRAKPTDGPKP